MTTDTNGNGNDATNIAKILQRVRKMITLANDAGATEGERDNALRMAHSTLAKYNLTMAQAEQAGTQTEEQREQSKQYGRGYAWARRAAYAVGDLFFCRYFYVRAAQSDRCWHYFVGRQSNVTTAQEMAHCVVESILREANKRKAQGGESWSWHTAFCKGATARVVARCEALRTSNDATSGTPGTAVVLASFYDRERKANDDYIANALQLRLKTGKSRERSTADAHGYVAGKQYGDSLSLSKQIGGAPSHKRIT